MDKKIQTERDPLVGSLKKLFQTRQIMIFFLLSFLISWLFYGLVILTNGLEALSILKVLGTFGPFIASVIIIKVNGGSILHWLRHIFVWRIKLRWYFVPLGIVLLVFAATALLYALMGGIVGIERINFESLVFLLIAFIMSTIIGGGQEELGWRGFALPKLQEKYNALTSSFILGFFWGVWHLPLFLISGTYQANSSIIIFILTVMAMTVLFTWLYNNTGSVLLSMIFHGLYNTIIILHILPTFDVESMRSFDFPEIPLLLQVSHIFVWIVLAVISVAIFGAERLTKKSDIPSIVDKQNKIISK